MARFLDDSLAPDVWQARRAQQVGGSVAMPAPSAPTDNMSGAQWQAARNAQVASAPVLLRDLGLNPSSVELGACST